MLRVKGEVRVDYLHLDCARCKEPVHLTDLRWVGGVPQVKIRCPKCGDMDDLKLWPTTWSDVVP